MSRIASWRPRLEAVALILTLGYAAAFVAGVLTALDYAESAGDWMLALQGGAVLLLFPLLILVVTRILYVWPNTTPRWAAVTASVIATAFGAEEVIVSFGGLVTVLHRMTERFSDYTTAGGWGSAVQSVFPLMAGVIVLWIAGGLLRLLLQGRPPRTHAEPESAPPAPFTG